MLIMDKIEGVASDLLAKIALRDLGFEPPVLPRSISKSQSSSSLSDGAGIAAPSGKSKSVSGHSSLGSTSVGAGTAVIVYEELEEI